MTYTIYDVVTQFRIQHGFHPLDIHCLNTGKPIGTMLESEFRQLIEVCAEDDLESTCDNLWTRVLVAMRPSPMWSVVQLDSLKDMLKTDRLSVLGYLLNRMTAPASLKTASLEMQLTHRANIIRRRVQLQVATASEESINRLLLALLAFDSKFNLSRYDSTSWFTFPSGMLDDTLVNQLANAVESREDAMVDAAEKEAKRQRVIATYPDGNRLTRSAFTKTWLESPQTALTADRFRKAHTTQRPISAKAAKAKANSDLLDSLLAELTGGSATKQVIREMVTPALRTPVAKPAALTVHPRRFGVKTGA